MKWVSVAAGLDFTVAIDSRYLLPWFWGEQPETTSSRCRADSLRAESPYQGGTRAPSRRRGGEHAGALGKTQARICRGDRPAQILAHLGERQHHVFHPARGARRAKAPLAGERDEPLESAATAPNAREPAGEDPAIEIGAQFAFDVAGQAAAAAGPARGGEERLEARANGGMKERPLGLSAAVVAEGCAPGPGAVLPSLDRLGAERHRFAASPRSGPSARAASPGARWQ